MNKKEVALDLFDQGFSCSQALLGAYASDFNIDKVTAFKISSGFGGGMGQLGETCGVITAGLMIIGLKYGRTTIDDNAARRKTNKTIREFTDAFEYKKNSLKCKDLLGCDLSRPEGLSYAKENKLFKKICPELIEIAVEILEELLEEKR